jgi:CRISPR/Cas system-associated exonuclease Cas4 (RecB family)
MMQIVYFSQKEQFLREIEDYLGEKIFITPSPAKADGLRSKLNQGSYADVITIAKFTANLITHLWAEDNRPLVKRKSELLLIFGILKNAHFPDLGFEQFIQAYNLFSDLRSFTLNKDILASALDEQAPEISLATQKLWTLLELTGFDDEHGAYHKITEALRSAEESEELNKTYIFWGFQHLNGQQIDLLKALAIRYQVVIPFPLDLKDKLKKTDWIYWLKESRIEELELEPIEANASAKWMILNSREVSRHLKHLINENDQVILGVSKLSQLHLNMLPSVSVNYKIPHELISSELDELAHELKQLDLSDLYHDDLSEILKARKTQSLKHFKANQLYLECLQTISELSSTRLKVDHFFLKLLADVVKLNQPRTSFVSLSPNNSNIDLKDMSSLEDLDPKRRIIVCVDERFGDFQSLGQNYTESIQRYLGALGPLKRNELELLFKQWEFKNFFSAGNSIVLMGKETRKQNLIWNKLFSEIDLQEEGSSFKIETKNLVDPLKAFSSHKFVGTLSASKLQSYIDCPRKFYFSYVDKIFPEVMPKREFDPMTAGIILHEIIEKFFNDHHQDQELDQLVDLTIQHYVLKNQLSLPPEVMNQYRLIFGHRSRNGIETIRVIERSLNQKIDWKFETSFELSDSIALSGKIDCIGVSNEFLLLLDFKSTIAATATEVENFENIQLWAYAHAAKNILPNFDTLKLILGFITLDNPANSKLLSDDDQLVKHLKSTEFAGGVHHVKEALPEKLKMAEATMVELVRQIKADEKFLPAPRVDSQCGFCELDKICTKRELPHV